MQRGGSALLQAMTDRVKGAAQNPRDAVVSEG